MELTFGAIGDAISQQLRKQKLAFDKDTVTHFEKDQDAVCRLKIRGLIGEAAAKSARDKLFKKITNHIKLHNKEY